MSSLIIRYGDEIEMPKKEREFTELKAVKLTKEQKEKWDRDTADKIRDLLDGKLETTNGVTDSLLRKMIPAFAKSGIILKLTPEEEALVKKVYKEVMK